MITLNFSETDFWSTYFTLLTYADEIRAKGRKEPATELFDLAENLYQQREKQIKNTNVAE